MIEIADCLVESHDLKLVLVAAVVCGLASAASFGLLTRVFSEQRRASAWIWLLLAATVAGSGVWATHFVAMIGFRPLVPIAYEFGAMAVSFLVSIVLTFCAFATAWIAKGRPERLVAGAILGMAVVVMHYSGAAGIRIPGTVDWSHGLVTLSIVFSFAFSMAAIEAVRAGSRGGWSIGATLFVIAVVLLHFTGMAALRLKPDPAIGLAPDLLSGLRLGYAVGAVTLLLVGSSIAFWTIDRRSRTDTDEKLLFLARHDTLTALPNRSFFQEIVARELVACRADGRPAAILHIDLDGFKEVNDLFGHAAGDHLLVEVANRLRGLLGPRCAAARLGGDEFAVLALGLETARGSASAAQRIIEALAAPFLIGDSRIDVGASIGIALFPDDGEDYATLLSNADTALLRAKTEGKGIFRFFERSMDLALRERRRLSHDLRLAVGTDQLRLAYQPQAAAGGDDVIGFEALLRWTRPGVGNVSPGVFVPIAEETGLILPIGEWVLREACREAASWTAPLCVAVNLSTAQFRQSGLPEFVAAILAETGLDPGRLELEVTESLFLEGSSRNLQTLLQIKALGVRIAMDDFGTGYSSLSTLQSFPFDRIKIDRSFTAQVGKTEKDGAIVRAILGLGRSLDMSVVAEGVETAEQLAYLREHGCCEIQGYLIGEPRPIAAYEALVAGPAAELPAARRVA